MKQFLAKLLSGEALSSAETTEAFELIMSGQASAAQIGALLAMMQMRGPTVEEIIGAAHVMRSKVTAVTVPQGLTVLDTCGTGGTHSRMFNVSTSAALVAAAAGRPHGVVVAKHGNRSVTSKSGSSQVLEALGVKLKVTGQTLTRCLDEAGMCFCFAPAHHPAMKYAAPVRAELAFRTLFNILGPLTNPAGATRQVMGVFSADLTERIAEALKGLGAEHAMVVHCKLDGQTSLAELATFAPTQVSHLQNRQVRSYEVDPAKLDLAGADPATMYVDSVQHSAQIIGQVLAGEAGPARDMVCLNAAAGLVVADLATDLREGLAMAAEAIDSGAGAAVLDRLTAITQADPTEPD